MTTPVLDKNLCLLHAVKRIAPQKFVSKLAIKTLVMPILPRAVRRNARCLHPKHNTANLLKDTRQTRCHCPSGYAPAILTTQTSRSKHPEHHRCSDGSRRESQGTRAQTRQSPSAFVSAYRSQGDSLQNRSSKHDSDNTQLGGRTTRRADTSGKASPPAAEPEDLHRDESAPHAYGSHASHPPVAEPQCDDIHSADKDATDQQSQPEDATLPPAFLLLVALNRARNAKRGTDVDDWEESET